MATATAAIVTREIKDKIADFSGLHPVINQLYQTRGITEPAQFNLSTSRLLSYHDLLNIDQAAALLAKAIDDQAKILIVGDFDTDGATSTALVKLALTEMGAKHVDYVVPNRFDFGYGLSPEIVDYAHQHFKPDYIITVDNGIANHSGVDRANELGIQVMITDHHLAAETLPNAAVIVNPNQPGDAFKSKNLAGVGVAFYTMAALRQTLQTQGWFQQHKITMPNMATWLDLVAVGTVADVVPLDDNNRILVQQGLLRIRSGRCRPGIVALVAASGRSLAEVTSLDLGFALGPRLNAAGRLDDMSVGIECLLTENVDYAHELANTLNELNIKRRDVEQTMQLEALAIVNQQSLDKQPKFGVCLYDKTWHQGVVGLVASRIKEKLYRPVIVFAKSSDAELKGSGRSIPGVHIRDVLANVAALYPDLIIKFGGHAMAAGLSIKQVDFKRFFSAFDAAVAKALNQQPPVCELVTDGELPAEHLNLTLATAIEQAGPWGQGFPEPCFVGTFDLLDQQLLKEKHLKLLVSVPNSAINYKVMVFNADTKSWPNHRVKQVRIVYRLSKNRFRGVESLTLFADYIAPLT